MRTSDQIREYANQHQIDEWSVFELAYYQTFGHYNENEINDAHGRWFNNGTCSGSVPWWLNDFIRKATRLPA